MSHWRSVWLVAKREILERGRSRGFVFSVLFTTLLVIGSFVLPAVLFGEDEPTRIGLVRPSPPGLEQAITATAAQFDHPVALVPLEDATAADAALEAETIDVVAEIPADLSSPGAVRFATEQDQAVAQIISASVIALRFQDIIAESGVEPGALLDAQEPPAIGSLIGVREGCT